MLDDTIDAAIMLMVGDWEINVRKLEFRFELGIFFTLMIKGFQGDLFYAKKNNQSILFNGTDWV